MDQDADRTSEWPSVPAELRVSMFECFTARGHVEIASIFFREWVVGSENPAWVTPEQVAEAIWKVTSDLWDLVADSVSFALTLPSSEPPTRGGPDQDDSCFKPVRQALDHVLKERCGTSRLGIKPRLGSGTDSHQPIAS